jgi:CheY-like chemotaxis protein
MTAQDGEPLRGVRVLVVDDDVDNREMAAITLEHCGARVTTAGSVAEALLAVEKERPDVLISDIGLPDEDGYSLLRKIRALPGSRGASLPAIALTGRGRDEDREQRARVDGFQEHLTKPVTVDGMLAAIARVTG